MSLANHRLDTSTFGNKAGRGGRPILAIANRFAAAIIGGFGFTYGFVAMATLGGFAMGLQFVDAQTFAWLWSFIVYLGALLWGFSARSGSRVWMVLGGGGVALSAASWELSRAMM